MFKLNFTEVEKVLEEVAKKNLVERTSYLQAQQMFVFTMCGGGLLGRSAAEQPDEFYIDSRVGRLPYPKKEILQAVKVLAILAKVMGLHKKLPQLPFFHASGVL